MNNKYPSPFQAWTTVGILSLTYMFSFIDRQILVLLIEPIKADLHITDTQVSLLTGFSFAVMYAVMGVPMGRAADIWTRKYVVIVGVSIWSTLTIFCGFARSFLQIFVARMGVGLGEAALTPTAYSMIADLFPPHRLARAMSVFGVVGAAGGTAMSLLLGGTIVGLTDTMGTVLLPAVGELRPWQIVLLAVGGASLMMVIPLTLAAEPKRHETIRHACGTDRQLSFKDTVAYMWLHKAFYAPFIAAISMASLYGYGSAAWIPSYFIRTFQWDAASTGITLGSLSLVPAILGGFFSGWLSDRLYEKGYQSASLKLIAIALVSLIPTTALFIYIPVIEIKLVLFVLSSFLTTMWVVLFPAIIQLATPNRMRGQTSAIHLLALNLVGLGLGPTAIALITDYAFQDSLAVGHSIAIVGVLSYGLGSLILCFGFKPFDKQVRQVSGDDSGTRSSFLSQQEFEVGKPSYCTLSAANRRI